MIFGSNGDTLAVQTYNYKLDLKLMTFIFNRSVSFTADTMVTFPPSWLTTWRFKSFWDVTQCWLIHRCYRCPKRSPLTDWSRRL